MAGRLITVFVLAIGFACAAQPAVAGAATTSLVSGGTSEFAAKPGKNTTYAGMTPNGSRVFFETTQKYVDADTDNNRIDVYERAGEEITLVSAGGNGDFDAKFLAASTDGSKVFFQTNEPMAGDSDGGRDIYMRSGGTTTLTSGSGGNVDVIFGGIAANGSRVVFDTTEKLELAFDTDTYRDVYEWSGTLPQKVSGETTTATSTFDGLSADGMRVYFSTQDSLVDADPNEPFGGDDCEVSMVDDGTLDVYENNLSGATTTTLVTPGGNHDQFAGMSLDGSHVFFEDNSPHNATQEPKDDCSNDVYDAHGASSRTLDLVSKAPTDFTNDACTPDTGGYFEAQLAGGGPNPVSEDGQVAFFQTDQKLTGDADSARDIYSVTGLATPQLVSTGTGNVAAQFAGASPDGLHAFWTTSENVGDSDGQTDIFETFAGVHQVSTGPSGGNGAFGASLKAVSADGLRAVFSTSEKLTSDDTDSNAADVYLRYQGNTTLLSIGPTAGTHFGDEGKGATFVGASRDGKHVFFTTNERLVDEDKNELTDLYVRSDGDLPGSGSPGGGNPGGGNPGGGPGGGAVATPAPAAGATRARAAVSPPTTRRWSRRSRSTS